MGSAFIISVVHGRIPTQLLLLKKSNNIEILLSSLSDFISFITSDTFPLHLKIVPHYSLKSIYNMLEQHLTVLPFG